MGEPSALYAGWTGANRSSRPAMSSCNSCSWPSPSIPDWGALLMRTGRVLASPPSSSSESSASSSSGAAMSSSSSASSFASSSASSSSLSSSMDAPSSLSLSSSSSSSSVTCSSCRLAVFFASSSAAPRLFSAGPLPLPLPFPVDGPAFVRAGALLDDPTHSLVFSIVRTTFSSSLLRLSSPVSSSASAFLMARRRLSLSLFLLFLLCCERWSRRAAFGCSCLSVLTIWDTVAGWDGEEESEHLDLLRRRLGGNSGGGFEEQELLCHNIDMHGCTENARRLPVMYDPVLLLVKLQLRATVSMDTAASSIYLHRGVALALSLTPSHPISHRTQLQTRKKSSTVTHVHTDLSHAAPAVAACAPNTVIHGPTRVRPWAPPRRAGQGQGAQEREQCRGNDHRRL